MLVFGGRGDQHGPFHTRSEKYCNILVCLDVERQEWFRPKTMGDTPEGRRSHSACKNKKSVLCLIFGHIPRGIVLVYWFVKDVNENDLVVLSV